MNANRSESNQCFILMAVNIVMEIDIVVNKWFYINFIHQRSLHGNENIQDFIEVLLKNTVLYFNQIFYEINKILLSRVMLSDISFSQDK